MTKTMMRRYLPSKLRFGAGMAVLMCLTLAAVLSLEGSPAGAQSGSGYVDLVVTNDYGSGADEELVIFVVHNYGTADANGVTVSFLLDKLQSWYGNNNAPPPSTVTVTDVEKADGQESFTWDVGNIPAGGSTSNPLSFGTLRNSTAAVPTAAPFYMIGSIRAEASSQTFEPSGLKDNNVRKVYAYSGTTVGLSYHMIDGKLGLFLSVDNLQPTTASPDVDFGLTARTLASRPVDTRASGAIADIEISVELSAGLQFKANWPPAGSGITKLSSRSATWKPKNVAIDTTNTAFDSSNRKIDIETALTGDSLQAIPLSERCITARVTDSIPPPEPGYALGSLKQCLGDDPTVLFDSGQLDLFTLYPCVGAATIVYPCRDEDGTAGVDNGLELVVEATVERHVTALRRSGIQHIIEGTDRFTTRGQVYLRPEKTIVQVKDSPDTRGFVKDPPSTGTTSMTWQTIGGDVARGVEVRENVVALGVSNSVKSTVWTSAKDKLTASGIDGGGAPGTVRIFVVNESFKIADAVNSGFSTAYDFGGGNGIVTGTVVLHFGELGTYIVGRAYKGTHSSVERTTDEETYIFHVGPIAELTVQDGGSNPELSADQRAFTIVAVNNGPDTAPAARVTVNGLDEGDVLSHSATTGEDSFDPASGVWSIGGLRESGYYQNTYGRDGEILTIVISDDASAEITATITNTQDYSVCINSSGNDVDAASESACTGTNTWHTTKYYDYISDNDSATINATGGTGTALPSQPVTEPITAIRVAWEPIAEVDGRTVTHYEVQRRTNPWETIAKVQDPSYFDLDVQPGDTHEYRIRAVNDREQSSPWSSSAEGTVPEPEVAPVAVVKPPATEPIRILRIEPSISEVSLKGGSYVRLNVEVYGRQDLRDDALGDRSDVTFDWALEEIGMEPGGTVGRLVGPEGSNNDRNRTSTLDGRRVLYIAPDSPGRYRIVVSLDPGTECLDQQYFETEEEAQARCTAVFEVNALRSSQIETVTLNPRNPEGEIPVVLADSEGFQYEVFTPVGGGAYVHESASVIAGAGAVPDYEMIGLRISESGAASNEGVTYGRYRLGGDWYDITAVDASGRRVEESYELNGVLDVCVPLPAELSSNISELAMVSMNVEDSLTIHSSRVRISMSGMKVCGHLSTVPTRVAVGTAGAPVPLPTAFPEVPAEDAGAGFPDAGGLAPPSVSVTVWMGVMGLSVVVLVVVMVVVWRRRV